MFLLISEDINMGEPIHLVYEHYEQAVELSLAMQKLTSEIKFEGCISIFRMIPLEWQSIFNDDAMVRTYDESLVEWEGKFYKLVRLESWQTFK